MTLSRFKVSSESLRSAEKPETEERPLTEEKPKKKKKTVRNMMMLGATALPFAGLIGEKPILHEGGGKEFSSLEELRKHLKPGSVVLSSPHKKTFTNLGIGLGTGVPDVSHAAFVDDLGRLVTIRDELPVVGPMIDKLEEGRAYTVLHPREGSPLKADVLARNYRRHLDVADQLEAAARARGATQEQINALRRNFYTKTPGFIRTPLHSVMAPTFGGIAGDEAKSVFEKFLQNPTEASIHDCAGGWCSLPGAMAFPKGHDVVPGRKPGDTTPVDFLRNPHLEAVGGYGRNKNQLVDKLIRAGPTAARLTYGVLGAGGIYLADKAIDALKKRYAEREKSLEESETGPATVGTV